MTEITGITIPRSSTAPAGNLGEADLIRYYSEAGPDYAAWSPAFNMHFGFARMEGNPLGRETMLERMNQEVLRRAAVGEPGVDRLIDLGCGLGATARHAVARFPQVHVTGVTIVPWQVGRARGVAAGGGGGGGVEGVRGGLPATGVPPK